MLSVAVDIEIRNDILYDSKYRVSTPKISKNKGFWFLNKGFIIKNIFFYISNSRF